MKDKLTISALIIVISIIISVLLYTFTTRYDLESYSQGNAIGVYKIDRITGETWLILNDKEIPVKKSLK